MHSIPLNIHTQTIYIIVEIERDRKRQRQREREHRSKKRGKQMHTITHTNIILHTPPTNSFLNNSFSHSEKERERSKARVRAKEKLSFPKLIILFYRQLQQSRRACMRDAKTNKEKYKSRDLQSETFWGFVKCNIWCHA